jgi:histidine kinase-like protein
MSGGFEFVLRGDAEAAWVARRAIAENDPALPGPLLDDLSLLVTELVTNAVRHEGATADGAIQIEIQRRGDCIRVDVVDPGTDFDPPAPGSNGNSAAAVGASSWSTGSQRAGVFTPSRPASASGSSSPWEPPSEAPRKERDGLASLIPQSGGPYGALEQPAP